MPNGTDKKLPLPRFSKFGKPTEGDFNLTLENVGVGRELAPATTKRNWRCPEWPHTF